MKKLRAYIEKNAILARMIAVFSAVGVVVILVLTIAMYAILSNQIKAEIYQGQVERLEQIANTVDFRAEYASSLMVQVKGGIRTSKLFFSTDTNTVKEGLDDLSRLRGSVKQLNSIYVYNQRADTIYYSGENGLPGTSTSETFSDKGFLEMLGHIGDYPVHTPILRRLSVENAHGQVYETYVYTYLLYDAYSSGYVSNVVAFNFYLGWMEDALDFISSGQTISKDFWIVDGSRQIIFTSSGKSVGTAGDPLILTDDMLGGESGYKLIGNGRNQQMLVYASPSRAGYEGWTFISWNDYASVLAPLKSARLTVYFICAGVLLLSLFVIFWCSRAIYKPVRKTMNRVEELEKGELKKRELERSHLLGRLFVGDLSDDINVIKEEFAKKGIQGNIEGDIRVILVSLDYLDLYMKKYADQLDEATAAVDKVIREEFGKHFPDSLYVRMQTGMWALSVPANENQDFSEIFTSLNRELERTMELSASMAVSGRGHSARDIPFLYTESLNIRAYRFLFGHGRLITANDIENQGSAKFDYPNEIEKRLLSSLFGGKSEEIPQIYNEFVAAVRTYAVEEIRLSFLLLAYAIKSASEKSTVETTSISLDFDKFARRLQSIETINGVHEMFRQLFEEITGKQQVHSKKRYEALIAQVKSYVQENYHRCDLSMNQISDHVNMSAAYLGRLFKQVTGVTFTEYLTEFRLDHACRLLREDSMTVNEISDAVGFTNSSYFYIIFKKNLICTPNQYRRQHSHSVESDET